MLLWFLVAAPVLVAEIFRSPMVDFRMVALGAVLPLAEVLVGSPPILHTLACSVGCLFGVMALTSKRRLLRRRLLGVPIGLFFHLVLDATWSNSELFWWPAFGLDLGAQAAPEAGRPLVVGLLLELVAIALGVWAWRRYGLQSAENRSLLWRRGHLARGVLG